MSEKNMQLIFWQPGKLQTFKQKMLKIEQLNLLPKWYFENHIDQRILFSFIEARNLSQNWRVKWGGGGLLELEPNLKMYFSSTFSNHQQIMFPKSFRHFPVFTKCHKRNRLLLDPARPRSGLLTGQFTKYLFFCLWAASAKKAAEQEVVNLIICGQIW